MGVTGHACGRIGAGPKGLLEAGGGTTCAGDLHQVIPSGASFCFLRLFPAKDQSQVRSDPLVVDG